MAVKQFRAMLSPVAPPSDPSPVPARSTSSATPSPSSSNVAEPATSPRQEESSLPVIDRTDGPSSSIAQMHSAGGAAPIVPPIPVPSTSSRGGRGRGRGAAKSQGIGRASRGRGGKQAGPSHEDANTPMKASEPKMSDKHTAALGLIQLSCASSPRLVGSVPASSTAVVSQSRKPEQQPEAQIKPNDVSASSSKGTRQSSRRKAKTSFLEPPDKPTSLDDSRDPSSLSLTEAAGASQGSVPSASSDPTEILWRAATTTLGKHARAQPDLVERDDYRPTTSRKLRHDQSQGARTDASDAMARMDGYLAGVKAVMDKEAELHQLLAGSEEILAMQVNLLRERVRNFEEEKTALLDMQRRQLRPGLITMKMTPRVQERVNQLFGSGGNGAGSRTEAPEAEAEAVRDISEPPTLSPPKCQNPKKADGTVPPMGFFRKTTGRQDSNTSSNMTLVPFSDPNDDGDTSEEESSDDSDTSEEWEDDGEASEDEWNESGHSSEEDSDASTESSWASTIPA